MGKACKDCVNFLEHDKGIVFCDWDFFKETKKEKAIIFCPSMFDCENFEDIRLLHK